MVPVLQYPSHIKPLPKIVLDRKLTVNFELIPYVHYASLGTLTV